MRKNEAVLFLDRDGTLIREPAGDHQVDSLTKLELMPGVIPALHRILAKTPYRLVMVTNQDGLGTSAFPWRDFWPVQKKMVSLFGSQGIEFHDILIDRSRPQEGCPTRKPKTGLVEKYLRPGRVNLVDSLVIGDRITDLMFARNIGCGAIWLESPTRRHRNLLHRAGLGPTCRLVTRRWEGVADWLTGRGTRQAETKRKTAETSAYCRLKLDGRGKSRIRTGLGFFDHMLEQLGFHAGFDLDLQVRGDLWVDPHHTMEDAALVLGDALKKSLGNRRDLNRYGFLLPMDDCVAEVAVDLSGRPYLIWEVEFRGHRIGKVPTEMFRHFFRSFADAGGMNLYIRSSGDNDHHRIEAVFKGLGRALRGACAILNKGIGIGSTKGILE